MYKNLTKEQLDNVLSTTSPHSFAFNISRMNRIYKLPINTAPTLAESNLGENAISRLTKFQKTLTEELAEFDTAPVGKFSIKEKLERLATLNKIIDNIANLDATRASISSRLKELGLAGFPNPNLNEVYEEMHQECLTDIADWLGDIIVYCRSEAMKFGIPLEQVLEAIMGSNFSKVGAVPQYDANGKVMKDLSRFVPPEDAIHTIMFGVDDE